MAITTTFEVKNLEAPDERHGMDGGVVEVANLPGASIARAVFQPGWRWSTNLAPMAGTRSCQVAHTGYIVSGRFHVRMDDGREQDLGPGDAHVVAPGHDAWVVGDDPCVIIDLAPAADSLPAQPTPGEARRYLHARPDEGQSPAGSPHLFKATASSTAGRFDFISGFFAPMTGPPLHLHHEQDDTFYVLEGTLTVQVGDDIFDMDPGDFLSIPPGTPHTFDNLKNGERLVRAINVMTPGGLFDMFDEMDRAAADPDARETPNQVAARHGTDILGPPLRVTLGLE